MQINIKPKKIQANSKSELIGKITQLAGHGCSKMYPLMTKDRQEVVLYSLEKHNKKVKINKRKKPLITAKGSTYQRELVSPKFWVAHVYFIPKIMIKKYEQKNRTFEITFK